MREFDNNISEHYMDKFLCFAKQNYPSIPKLWNDEDIEFTALIESGSWDIIGLIIVVPYDGDKVHIKFLAVAEHYRGKGFGLKLLTHIAAKYPHDEITLNITLDRLDLLNYYCKRGYAVQKHKIKNIIILSLNKLYLLSKLPI